MHPRRPRSPYRWGTEHDATLLTAIVIARLSHVRVQATYRQVRTKSSIAALRRAVQADVVLALRIGAPTLDALDGVDGKAAAARKVSGEQDRSSGPPGAHT